MHASDQNVSMVCLNGEFMSRNGVSYWQYDSTCAFNSSIAVRVCGSEYLVMERFRFADVFTSDGESYSVSFEGERDIWRLEFVRESGMCREDVFWWSV